VPHPCQAVLFAAPPVNEIVELAADIKRNGLAMQEKLQHIYSGGLLWFGQLQHINPIKAKTWEKRSISLKPRLVTPGWIGDNTFSVR